MPLNMLFLETKIDAPESLLSALPKLLPSSIIANVDSFKPWSVSFPNAIVGAEFPIKTLYFNGAVSFEFAINAAITYLRGYEMDPLLEGYFVWEQKLDSRSCCFSNEACFPIVGTSSFPRLSIIRRMPEKELII